MISCQAFIASFEYVLKEMMLPYQPLTSACGNCGNNPIGVVFDGTSLGTLLARALDYYKRLYWNQLDLDQNGILRTNTGGVVVNSSTTYKELTILQGKCLEQAIKWTTASQKTQANAFVNGMWNPAGNRPRQVYTLPMYEDFVSLLVGQSDGPKRMDNARAILYLVRGVSSTENILIPQHDNAMLKIQHSLIGCKNVTKLQSPYGGGPYLIACLALSLGCKGNCKIPSFFQHIKSSEEIDYLDAQYLKMTGTMRPVNRCVNEQMANFKQRIQDMMSINYDLLIENLVRPEKFDNESISSFCSRLCGNILRRLEHIISYQLHRNDELFDSLSSTDDVINSNDITILQIMDSTFPPLRDHLSDVSVQSIRQENQQYTLLVPMRPQFAFITELVANIWFKNVKYHVYETAIGGRNKISATVYLNTIVNRVADHIDDEIIAGKENTQLLHDLLEQNETVALGDNCVGTENNGLLNDLRSGFYCLESKLRICKKRAKYPLADKEHKTNTSRSLGDETSNSYNMHDGEIGHCKKTFPSSSKHTSGFFTILCTCSRRCVLFICHMETSESSRFPRNALIDRFPVCPRYIFYDNCCEFHLFCMARDPIYFFCATFLIDSVHYKNHIATCSCSYHRDLYSNNPNIQDVNSEACEQLFSAVKRTIAVSVRQMNPANAVLYFAVYCIFYNAVRNK